MCAGKKSLGFATSFAWNDDRHLLNKLGNALEKFDGLQTCEESQPVQKEAGYLE